MRCFHPIEQPFRMRPSIGLVSVAALMLVASSPLMWPPVVGTRDEPRPSAATEHGASQASKNATSDHANPAAGVPLAAAMDPTLTLLDQALRSEIQSWVAAAREYGRYALSALSFGLAIGVLYNALMRNVDKRTEQRQNDREERQTGTRVHRGRIHVRAKGR
jgi:hypothetical protein